MELHSIMMKLILEQIFQSVSFSSIYQYWIDCSYPWLEKSVLDDKLLLTMVTKNQMSNQ